MPVYTFKCKSCDHQWDEIKTISEMDVPLESPCVECKKEGDISRVIYAPNITATVNVKNKVPHWMKDKMREIKKDRAGTQMDHLI